MPFHLTPLSRRRFFGGAAIFTLGSGITRLSGEETPPQHWALLADTHVAADPDFESRQGVNMANHLERVVAELLREKDTLSGVIIDGDCAFDDGQTGDYVTLAKLLAPLREAGLPIHFTLGNHDNRDTFYETYSALEGTSLVESKHVSVIETPFADWILLDTLRFVNKVEGEIGEEQLRWVSERLRQNAEKPAIVVGHHYPQVFRTDVIPSEEPIRISGLVDSPEFLEMLSSHTAAKAYLYGHSHNWGLREEEDGVHHVNLPPTSYVFDSARPSGWVRATLSPGGCSLELRALDASHEQHGETHQLTWRRS